MPNINFYFRFSLLGTILAIIGISGFTSLGIWQTNRALEKQQLQRDIDNKAKQDGFQLNHSISDINEKIYLNVNASGRYNKNNEILIDNIVYSGQAGYHVLTPFILDKDQTVIMVNRGWIPVGRDRNILPLIETPEDEINIHGILAPHKSKPPLILGELDPTGRVWPYYDLQKYIEHTKYNVLPVMILLDKKEKSGYARDWPKYDAKMGMHIGYAIQWFVFALIVLITYIAINFKKKVDNDN